jgi:sterol 24-C-methyltransferase
MPSQITLEKQDRARDAAFNQAMHGNSAEVQGGVRAMFAKGREAKQAAVDEYFKHWDNKAAETETEETRAVCPNGLFSTAYWY